MKTSPIKISISIFVLLLILIVRLSFNNYDAEFYNNVLVEAHGLLLDLIVFGTIILWFDQKRQKSDEKDRLIELIQDFSAWRSDESAVRVFGAYRRLRKIGDIYHLKSHYLRNIDFKNVRFNKTDFSQSDFSFSRLLNADYRYSTLESTIFDRVFLQNADFRGAHLLETDFSNSDLRDAIFSGTTIQRVKFKNAMLEGANFNNAYFLELDLRETDINKINLEGVKYQLVEFPKHFDPKLNGMIEVFDYKYEHEPTLALLKKEDLILNEGVGLVEQLIKLNNRT